MTDRSTRKFHLRWPRRRRSADVAALSEPIVDPGSVQALVAELGLGGVFDTTRLAQLVAAKRVRPVEMQPYPEKVVQDARQKGETLPYGMWINNASTDYVFYHTDTTPTHQEHIKLHELGHMFCGHKGPQLPEHETDEPELGPEAMARAIKRADGFETEQENAAELFAYLVERSAKPAAQAADDQPENRYQLLEDYP